MRKGGAHYYFATACGHRHRTAAAAARCRARRYDVVTKGLFPVIEVTVRPGSITRTRTVEEQEAGQ
jgi:hypothetical protein